MLFLYTKYMSWIITKNKTVKLLHTGFCHPIIYGSTNTTQPFRCLAPCLLSFFLEEDGVAAVAADGPGKTVSPLMSLEVEPGSSSTVFWASMWTIRSRSCHVRNALLIRDQKNKTRGLGGHEHGSASKELKDKRLCFKIWLGPTDQKTYPITKTPCK